MESTRYVHRLCRVFHAIFIGKNDQLNDLFHYLFRILEYCLDFLDISLSAIRTIRVMRPLRAVNRIPSKFQFHDLCLHR